eukprot:CAMPEP_0202698596 /NCGR_PEP_ID=MMETSP1385-20130828/11864_1 /ASSEMBLY_ACC=CAM_ASM_000861 /TAXON_ID=933848 /ORGANISM="Elphidium margaritaceum" /LENGTH=484 /DNA_ID=CAMNT_0049355349 /DNA_START=44 /DNA_END=1498 /DNA_ORIENTATION=-
MSTPKPADLKLSPPSHLAPERSIPYHLPSPDNSPSVSPVLSPVEADNTTSPYSHSSASEVNNKTQTQTQTQIPIQSPSQHVQVPKDDSSHEHDTATAHKYTLFENQVAGTLPMFYCDGEVYKPLKSELEGIFYRNITQWLPSMQPFIPTYSGMQCLDVQSDLSAVLSHHDTGAVVNNAWSQQMFEKNKHRITKMPYLRLEDLTSRYRKPCILDLKIGTRHFAPVCKTDKMQRKLRKAWKSTCRDFGVRIGGLQSYDAKEDTYHTLCKHNAAVLDKNAFCAQLVQFFKHMPDAHMMHAVVAKLTTLMQILKHETRFRWFSCSLLFTYEGATDDDAAAVVSTNVNMATDDDNDNDNDSHSHSHQQVVDLRLIDFTNFVVVQEYLDALQLKHTDSLRAKSDSDIHNSSGDEQQKNGGVTLQLSQELDNLHEPDHGILFGLQSLIKLLSELQMTHTIKTRNDAEWQHFTSTLSHSKMALRPFSTITSL